MLKASWNKSLQLNPKLALSRTSVCVNSATSCSILCIESHYNQHRLHSICWIHFINPGKILHITHKLIFVAIHYLLPIIWLIHILASLFCLLTRKVHSFQLPSFYYTNPKTLQAVLKNLQNMFIKYKVTANRKHNFWVLLSEGQ